ncbi:MAG: ABC transporter ATP-binding protein [Planctomycetota bacterium]|jgi:ABC-type multidrug transport system fused ATPase/permease subunit
MKSFWRVFKYIWPQWPRLIVVITSAIVVSILFSLSFMTVIPLLKVMMGEEGLYGWIDRKVCSQRYGIEFYVPDRADFVNPSKPDVAYYLLVQDIEDDGLAKSAGLQTTDWIIGAGNCVIGNGVERIISTKIFEALSTAESDKQIRIQYKRFDIEEGTKLHEGFLTTGKRPFYLGWVDRLSRYLPREQSNSNKVRAVTLIIMLMVIFTLGRCTARFFQQYLAGKVSQTALGNLRQDMFAHAVDLPVGFFESQNPSDLVSRLIRDSSQLAIGVKILLGKTLREPLKAIALLASAMWLDYKLTLIFLICAPFTIMVVSKLGRKIKRATTKSLVSWSRMLGKLEESFSSVKVVKAYNSQDYEINNFNRINKGLLKQQFRISKNSAAMAPLMDVLGMFAGSAALLFGVHWVVKGQIDASEFLIFIALLGAAAESVRKSGDIWTKIQQANAASERIYTVIDMAGETEAQGSGLIELGPMRWYIEYENVYFGYPGSERKVLKGVSLKVQAGHNVAIVGANGSGKTTLANLMPRFYEPDSGRILIDGQDIRGATLLSVRNQIGMVTQNVVTFNDTIAANIAYGRPGASREDIIGAAKRAFAHEFIEPLPNGYDTIIGEKGTGLSGGQLQRIVIARAILKDPVILIFDEATSQVDAESEAKIHRAIEEIMKDRTSFIIAHRFSTVVSADIIVVMSEGRIVAQGQHDELMGTCSIYQSLYETQLVKA